MHGGTLSRVGWSDAAYGDLSQNGKGGLGYLIRITSSSPSGPCHISQWATKFTRKLVKSGLGGEVYAFSEMIDHMALLREFHAPCSRISPGMVGMEDCESLFTHLKNREMVTEKFPSNSSLGMVNWKTRNGSRGWEIQLMASLNFKAKWAPFWPLWIRVVFIPVCCSSRGLHPGLLHALPLENDFLF